MSLSDIPEFISRFLAAPLDASPDVLDEVLQPSLDAEDRLRAVYAGLQPPDMDLYLGLVDVFSLPLSLRLARTRPVERNLEVQEYDGNNNWSRHYIFPTRYSQRIPHLDPCMVGSLDDFRRNFSTFTMGILNHISWDNIVVAGGSILACLCPPPSYILQGRLADYYHQGLYKACDLDVFIYGLSEDLAIARMIQIYEDIRQAIPFEVLCLRKRHTVTIISQYPFRPVQIILRLYRSPSEILSGFDVDAPCLLYNGTTVYANPRSIMAIVRRCNTISITRRSASYEYRLYKYSLRGFEVRIPSLRRDNIRQALYDRDLRFPPPPGLARLIVFEALATHHRYTHLRLPGYRSLHDMHSLDVVERYNRLSLDMVGGESWYDVSLISIPYGPQWNAQQIRKLVKTMQIRLNWLSTFLEVDGMVILAPGFLWGHMHGIYAGSMQECTQVICPACPTRNWPWPTDFLKGSVQGPLTFITHNPGQQLFTGSFIPIDDHLSWEMGAYRPENPELPFMDSPDVGL